jgi:hypothetical protein
MELTGPVHAGGQLTTHSTVLYTISITVISSGLKLPLSKVTV